MPFGDSVGPARNRAAPVRETGGDLPEPYRAPGRWAGLWTGGQRIGLLGGSFNPAHPGHVHISRQAALALGLDAVWWLVSPGNPQKDPAANAPLDQRISAAKHLSNQHLIAVTDIERDLNTRYTANTVARLMKRMPKTHFVWLMGADNLESVHTWRDWSRIFHLCPIAVVGRPTYSLRALNSKASIRFRSSRRNAQSIRANWHQSKKPLWTFIFCRLHPASSTRIRHDAEPEI